MLVDINAGKVVHTFMYVLVILQPEIQHVFNSDYG